MGGTSLNFATYAKRCGAESFLCSAVEDDKLGKEARVEASRLGVDDRFFDDGRLSLDGSKKLGDERGKTKVLRFECIRESFFSFVSRSSFIRGRSKKVYLLKKEKVKKI